MTVRPVKPGAAGPRGTTPGPAARKRRSVTNRTPVEKLLPQEIKDKLQRIAGSVTPITPELAEELDRRFSLARQHGVSPRRLSNYLRRLRRSKESEPGSAGSSSPCAQPATPEETLQDRRTRQAYVAEILQATFGDLAHCNPELWDRRAYLMLVGLVYERLAVGEEEISTEEVVALAKVLSESRRIALKANEAGRAGDESGKNNGRRGPLPNRFAEVVRQVYGTNFQSPAEPPTPAPPAGNRR